jgi:ribosomal protein S30
VDQVLSRLTKAGKIRRVVRGVYDIPRTHPLLGILSPDPEAVARSIAAQAGYRLQPTPAHAANALGLSTQVPAKIVYLTDGSSRKIKVGNQIIHFKHAGSKALLGAGTSAGVVLQAIRAFGPDHLTADIIQKLKRNLPPDAKNDLKKLARHVPNWMAPTIDAITA